jgi:hypothetical protein
MITAQIAYKDSNNNFHDTKEAAVTATTKQAIEAFCREKRHPKGLSKTLKNLVEWAPYKGDEEIMAENWDDFVNHVDAIRLEAKEI